MVDAVSNIPFSYYNVLNPTAAQPQPASDNSTATADSTAFDTAVGGSTSAPQATATATAGPQLPADVIALLQQYLSPSTSDPAAALLGTDTAGGNNDLLSALLSV
ncbi:MAG: hypothetical protein JO089_07750, partial [Alphaproteobacteria bacterium]|nr:hypothetical protein [Alphaproteobacteria bacterium]